LFPVITDNAQARECARTTTPAGRMMMQMVGAFAMFGRAVGFSQTLRPVAFPLNLWVLVGSFPSINGHWVICAAPGLGCAHQFACESAVNRS
jgi:hypothetical protein